MAIWQHWLGPGDLFVDVGANVGLYSLVAHERGATVIAVEPAADMIDRLHRHIVLNRADGIEVYPVALLDTERVVGLAGPDPNRRRTTTDVSAGAIQATTLDSLLAGRRPSGIKIDVEGNENAVLAGAMATIRSGVELIQLEWNDLSVAARGETRDPLAATLSDAGFELSQISEDGRLVRFGAKTPPPFGGDVFAARGAASALLADHSWTRRRA